VVRVPFLSGACSFFFLPPLFFSPSSFTRFLSPAQLFQRIFHTLYSVCKGQLAMSKTLFKFSWRERKARNNSNRLNIARGFSLSFPVIEHIAKQ
jgi:hypothetical protein